MKKRLFSLLTTLVMVVSLVSVVPTMTASAAGGVQQKVNSLVSRWNGKSESACAYNNKAWQCYGFAKHASMEVFGLEFVRGNSNGAFSYVTSATNSFDAIYNSCKPGDILDTPRAAKGYPHTAVVVSKGSSSITFIHYSGGSVKVSEIPKRSWSSWWGGTDTLWRASNYNYIDGPVSNVVTWNELWDSERGETATTFIGGAYISNGEITDWGFRYNITGSSDYHYIERPSQSWDNSSKYFRFVKWTDRVLREGTDYQVYAYIDVEGVRHWSNCFSLRTNGHSHSYTTNFSTNYYAKKTCSCGDVIESWNNNYYNGDYAFCATIKCVGTNKYLGISNNKGGTNVDEVSYNVEANNIDLNDSTYWLFEKQSDGYYKISNVKSGGVLDVYGVEDKDCANVHAYHTFVNGNNQLWRLYKNGSYFYLKPKHSNRCLDIAGNVTNANIYQYNGTVAQQFVIDVHKHDWVVDVIKNQLAQKLG